MYSYINNKAVLAAVLIISMLASASSLLSQDIENIPHEKPITANGSIGINAGLYSMSGTEKRFRPFDYSIIGNFTLNTYGIIFPFSATVSEQQRSFTQPFNQYGVSPRYKWITLHAGWRSLYYSPLILSGYNFLGGGLELTPGILRLSALYGRFVAPVIADTTSGAYNSSAYSRYAYAVKLGFGSQDNYTDLIMLHGKDRENSLPEYYGKYIKPVENTAVGVTGRYSIIKQLSIEFDASASLFTNDTRSSRLNDSIDASIPDFLKNMVNIHTSSQLTFAMEGYLNYRTQNFGAKIGYKRIEPDYKTIGLYYTESDVENYTFAPYVSLMKNTLRFGGSVGWQKNNLLNTKSYTSERLIYSLDGAYNRPEWGATLRYSSYGTTQAAGLNPVIDTLRIARVNHNLNLSGRCNANIGDDIKGVAFLSAGYQVLQDLNDHTAGMSKSNSISINTGYQAGTGAEGMTFGGNINYVNSRTAVLNTTFVGPGVQAGKNWKIISLTGSAGYQVQLISGSSRGGTFNAAINALYNITAEHSIRIDGSFISSKVDEAYGKSFTEARLNLGYIYNFNINK